MRSVLTCEAEVGVCACATAGTWPPGGWSTSARRSASSPRSRSVSRARSSRCGRSTRVASPARTSRTASRAWSSSSRRASPRARRRSPSSSGAVAIEDDEEKKVRRITVTSDDGDQVEYPVSLRARLAVSDGDARRGRPAAHRGFGEPAREAAGRGRAGAAAAPGGRGPAGVPLAGRDDPRQAHRADRRARCCRKVHIIEPGRHRVPAGRAGGPQRVRGEERRGRRVRRRAGLGPADPDGHHEGLAGHRLVAVRGLLPGDHAGADRGGHQRASPTRCSA